YLAVGWLWYMGTLIPVIGLVQVGAQGMADRFTYVPHIGVSLAAAWGFSTLSRNGSRRTLLVSVSCGLALCLLAASTRTQLRYWKDNISLFSRAVQVTRGNFLAHHLLGNALAQEGRKIEAMSHFSEALRINPAYVPSLYNLAFTLAREGRLQEAAAAYSDGLRLSPKDANLHNNLGNVLARMGQREEAIRHFVEALKIDPRYAAAHNNLASVFLEQGRLREAVQHYKKALRFQPDLEEARHNLDRALRKADDQKDKDPRENTNASR
ncbi:MAG: tetratricopeptide repeat protein, partial [Deltaproteobacteria bacterium]|nr:tetratricopeptide repeat protein [Deltaproteobacteria bacterium]